MKFCEKIREARKNAGLKQDEFAKAIGVSNFYAHVLVNFVNTVEIKPMVNQVELHPYYTQENSDNYSFYICVYFLYIHQK